MNSAAQKRLIPIVAVLRSPPSTTERLMPRKQVSTAAPFVNSTVSERMVPMGVILCLPPSTSALLMPKHHVSTAALLKKRRPAPQIARRGDRSLGAVSKCSVVQGAVGGSAKQPPATISDYRNARPCSR